MSDIVIQKEPIVCHVRGRDNWNYWTRLYWAAMLICGFRIKFAFCSTFQARFLGEVFIGLEYLGSKPQLAIGKTVEHDIEDLDPIVHFVIDKDEVEARNKIKQKGVKHGK